MARTSNPSLFLSFFLFVCAMGLIHGALAYVGIRSEQDVAEEGPMLDNKSCSIPTLVGDWEPTTPYPKPIAEAMGGIVGHDFIVFSGFTEVWQRATAETYAIDLNDYSCNAGWRRMDDIPVPEGITHAAIAIVGMKVYMCGGYLGGHPGPHIPTCLVYDHSISPGTGAQWEFLPPLPDGRGGGSLVYIERTNSLLYTGGAERPVEGVADAFDYEDTWIYSFNTEEWTAKEDLPFLSNHMSFSSAKDEHGVTRYFVLGGQIGENEHTGNVDNNYEWDVENEEWIQRQSMAFTRGHASSSTRGISCGFIVAGGSTNEYGKTKDISYYDTRSDSWTSIGKLPQRLNTPVCDIDFENGYLYCETGFLKSSFSYRRKIVV